tara:strand:- start:1444 stop:2049 length:606 start_codon:yes stop_codon:yes gene_type:complete
MDQFPDISMPPEVKEDLEIIETEDLKADPFIRQPPIKPPAPETPASKPKAKRQVSEKQKAHLANARKLARERKQAMKKEKEEKPKQDVKEEPKTDSGLPVTQAPPVDGFEQFLGYMDKYSDMMLSLKEEERKKREEEERKEKELEAKYFKKFQEQQKQNLDKIQNDPVEKEQPVKGPKIPKKNLDILSPPQPDFGEYSSYF